MVGQNLSYLQKRKESKEEQWQHVPGSHLRRRRLRTCSTTDRG